MPVQVVVGCQWGDEGKGKIVDTFARRADWVARWGGGSNAGHTVRVGGETFILRLIPSGILNPRPKCVIGHGVVADPVSMLDEIDRLAARGVAVDGRIFVSEAAHVLLPSHPWIEALGGQDVRVGTTKRGIGPAYQDKAARVGIRFHDLMDAKGLRRRLEEHAHRLALLFKGADQPPPIPLEQAVDELDATFTRLRPRLSPLVADTVELLHGALARGERILCEGAQGTFLDLDLGTYPFVTSSTTTAAGAATGLGLPPRALREVYGVCKAYSTRVGAGPFPTELSAVESVALREKGGEYGSVTGRPRRVGWLDLPQLRQAVRVNGLSSLIVTKLDILSGMDPLPICTAYDSDDGLVWRTPPLPNERLERCRPRLEAMSGWSESLCDVRRFEDLPSAAKTYLARIEREADCPIRWVSVGSEREAILRAPSKRIR